MIRKFFGFVFTLIVLAVIVGIPCRWMYRRSYSNPEVHYYSINENVTAPESDEITHDSLRFAVLSDLCGYVFDGGNGQISNQVANTSPDAILICGNMIMPDADSTEAVSDLVKSLSQIAPVYYSYGKQEAAYAAGHTGADGKDPLREVIEKAGAVVLNEEYKDVVLYGVSARIGGMHEKAYELLNLRGEVKRKYESTWEFLNNYQDTDSFKVMLTNDPESFVYGDACEEWKVDLVVSGHTLGGRVVLPYYGGVFGGSQGYFPEYVHGLYEKGDVVLFITSGLSAPEDVIPRFNNPPEIAVLDISGINSNQ